MVRPGITRFRKVIRFLLITDLTPFSYEPAARIWFLWDGGDLAPFSFSFFLRPNNGFNFDKCRYRHKLFKISVALILSSAASWPCDQCSSPLETIFLIITMSCGLIIILFVIRDSRIANTCKPPRLVNLPNPFLKRNHHEGDSFRVT